MSTSTVTKSDYIKSDYIKSDYNKLEDRISHVLVNGFFIFVVIMILISIIYFFIYSPKSEAFRFRNLFYEHDKLNFNKS